MRPTPRQADESTQSSASAAREGRLASRTARMQSALRASCRRAVDRSCDESGHASCTFVRRFKRDDPLEDVELLVGDTQRPAARKKQAELCREGVLIALAGDRCEPILV